MTAILYWGTREALQAELGIDEVYSGKYILAAYTENGEQYTPEDVDSLRGARELIAEYRRHFGELDVRRID